MDKAFLAIQGYRLIIRPNPSGTLHNLVKCKHSSNHLHQKLRHHIPLLLANLAGNRIWRTIIQPPAL
eukprot:6476318-Amphidinium_carterae.2